MKDGVLRRKTYEFALKVIRVYKQIITDHREYQLSKQFLKFGTSPGALVRKIEYAQSRADFISKLSIALKESNETDYWISLLRDSGFISLQTADDLLPDNTEITKMLISSINTSKKIPLK
jgi:four helix bundle protein